MLFPIIMSISILSIILVFWASAIGYLPKFLSKYEKNALAIVVGFTFFILIITISGFLDLKFEKYSTYLLIIYLVILIYSLYLFKKSGYSLKEIFFSKELILLMIFLLAIILVYLYPMLDYNKLATIYYYSGDFHSYWSHGFILQKHPIGSSEPITTVNSLIQSYVDYRNQGLRIGASEVLAFISYITDSYPQSVFSVLSSLILGLQALMFSLLIYILTRKNMIIALISLLLYGTHPLFSWEMYASFYPQGYGLLFLMAIMYIYQSEYWKDYPLRISIFLSLFISALALTYVEILAVAFLVILFSFLINFKKSELKNFLKVILLSTVFSLFITSISLDYIIKGLIIQLHASSFGGGQIITIQTVLSLLFGFMRAPLDFNNINEFSTIVPSFLSFTLILFLSIIVLFNIFKMQKNIKKVFITWIVLFALILAYVVLRYDSSAMTWNMFKVLNYFGPLLFAIIIVSIFSLKSKKIFLPIIVIFLFCFSIGQYQLRGHLNKNVHFVESKTLIQSKDEFNKIKKITRQYQNELFYIGHSLHKERFELYALLAFNNFITVYEPPAIKIGELDDCSDPFRDKLGNFLSKSTKELQSYFEKNGVSFLLLLKSEMNKYSYNKVLFDNGKIVLLDVRKLNFVLPVQIQYNKQKQSVLWVNYPNKNKKVSILLANGRAGEVRINNETINIVNPFTAIDLNSSLPTGTMQITHPGYLSIYNYSKNNDFKNTKEIPINLSIADVGGDKNTIKQISVDSVSFKNKEFTSSYLVFPQKFDKGLYYFELNMGNINIESDSKILEESDGRPVFFGVESNNFLTFKLVNTDSNHMLYYPFYIDHTQTIRFYVGIGGWCLSKGNVEFNKIKLLKVVDSI